MSVRQMRCLSAVVLTAIAIELRLIAALGDKEQTHSFLLQLRHKEKRLVA